MTVRHESVKARQTVLWPFTRLFMSDIDPEFKRLKEEHLVKMASLRQEAELLKQQAEVEKMRKELKDLRGESLPLEENRKVAVRMNSSVSKSWILSQTYLVSFEPEGHVENTAVKYAINTRACHARFTRGEKASHVFHTRRKLCAQVCFSVSWPVMIGTYVKWKSRFLEPPVFRVSR